MSRFEITVFDILTFLVAMIWQYCLNINPYKAITLRMTQEEFDFFQKQMQTAKPQTQTDFFLSVLRKKPIIVIEDLCPMLQELKRQGNNLNQIARKLNETSSFGESATRVRNECWKAYRAVTALEVVVVFWAGMTGGILTPFVLIIGYFYKSTAKTDATQASVFDCL